MKKLLILTMLIAGFAHADDSEQRISELTKVLESGSYSQDDTIRPKRKNLPQLNAEVEYGWMVSCKKDIFDGKKICYAHQYGNELMVSIINGKLGVFVGRNHFPRTKSAIKIDGNQTIYGYEGVSQTPQKVVEQMKKGKIAHTRYQEWPYEYNKDGEVDLSGFAEKYDEMVKQYQAL
ncbi:hypothetical protein [Acinetobacter sp. YH16031]|uniref:hypothetical protein n=1 Tax=Acinetobacter sp. YH16031 TaxID=2601180 RepID=UPI0015D2A3C8|nr:hypothetical protein [Acinetobacter sp. YH16031]